MSWVKQSKDDDDKSKGSILEKRMYPKEEEETSMQWFLPHGGKMVLQVDGATIMIGAIMD